MITNLNQCYNEDCYIGLKKLESKSIDLVITDPPYVLQNKGEGLFNNSNRVSMNEIKEMNDGFNYSILDEMCRVLKKINVYIFCSQKQIPILYNYFVTQKKCNWNLLCWHKTNPVPACKNKYLSDTEYCLFFRESGVKVYGKYDTKKTYYVTPLNTKEKKLYNHPTVKPVNIIENLIVNSSMPNDIILDPFAGTGTSAVAAINTGRKYIIYEINKQYYDVCWKRINEAITSQW